MELMNKEVELPLSALGLNGMAWTQNLLFVFSTGEELQIVCDC